MRLVESIRKVLLLVMVAAIPGIALQAQENRIVIDRDGSTIALEPYAPNIVRVTLSTLKAVSYTHLDVYKRQLYQ